MTTACRDYQPVFDSLIDGLAVGSYCLDAKCEEALRALGGRAIPRLRLAAAKASPRQRNRIQRLESTIGVYEDLRCDAGRLVGEALATAVMVQNNRADNPLVPAIQAFGPGFVDILVQKAVIHFRRPAVCLRILRVIEQLGESSQALIWMDLLVLTKSKSTDVRELAFRLFSRIRQNREVSKAVR